MSQNEDLKRETPLDQLDIPIWRMFEEDLKLLAQELRQQEHKSRLHLTSLSIVNVLRSREPQLAATNLFSNSERVSPRLMESQHSANEMPSDNFDLGLQLGPRYSH